MSQRTTACITLMATICFAQSRVDQRVSSLSDPDANAEKAMAALLGADDLEKMCALPKVWTSSLGPDVQKSLVLALLKKLESTQRLKTPSRYGAVVNLSARSKEQTFKDLRHELDTTQDLLIESGRCAWALEVMLECSLPQFTHDMRPSEVESFPDMAWTLIDPHRRTYLKETAEIQADKAIQRLLAASDPGSLNSLPTLWYHTLPDAAKKDLLLKLLRKLDSPKELKLDNGANVIPRVRAGKQKLIEGRLWINQDLFLENGRCAFAIERLLDFDARASFTEEVAKDSKKLQETIRNFILEVVAHMDLPKVRSKTDHEK
jgi:hypothetical protein